jgi:small acid-soluble spore protein F (minor alpha/beta-type SASP)
MGKTPLKKVIKSKLKSNRQLTDIERLREEMKYEIAAELGLEEKVYKLGWSGLTAKETGKIGGIMTKRKKDMNLPKNKEIIMKNGYADFKINEE